MKGTLIPFGKYKDQPIASLSEDPQYLQWLLNEPWFQERYPELRTIVVNNFKEPSETPEHNKLQVLFLDREFREHFVELAIRDRTIDSWQRAIKEYEIKNAPDLPIGDIYEPEFEVKGADVVLEFDGLFISTWSEGNLFPNDNGYANSLKSGIRVRPVRWRIECKPALSDEYPAVLRQMRSSNCHILLIGDDGITAQGATEKQIRKIFDSADIRIIKANEITGCSW